jgi:hypothetical protein
VTCTIDIANLLLGLRSVFSAACFFCVAASGWWGCPEPLIGRDRQHQQMFSAADNPTEGAIPRFAVSRILNPSGFSVGSSAELMTALKAARGGEVIRLAPGRYPALVIANMHFTVPVIITSADKYQKAVLIGLGVANSSGIIFDKLELTSVGSEDPFYGFRLSRTENISFVHMDVHGSGSIDPSKQMNGFYITYCSSTVLSDSKFHDMNSAIVANNDNSVTIARNSFFKLNKGGIEMGGSSDVKIGENSFTDFRVSRGTHSDAIQIYTAGTKVVAHDIDIEGNLFHRGAGDPVQGIFVQDEVGTLPFHNLTIRDNAILGGMWDSIYVRHVIGELKVANNVAASWPGPDMEGVGTPAAMVATAPISTTSFRALIWLRGDLSGAKVTAEGNTAQEYKADAGWIWGGDNHSVGSVDDKGAALLRAWNSRRVANGLPLPGPHSDETL